MPKASIINQATKLIATLNQQGHTVKAMEIDGDKIRIEFAVNADDLEANPPHEFDFVDWNAALKEWLEPQEDNRNDEPTVPVSGVRYLGVSYVTSISNRYWITKPFLPFTSRNL